MDIPIKFPFRFLSPAEFEALDIKGKALYLVRANQELEVQRDILRRYHARVAGQVAAIFEMRGDETLPGSPS